LPHLLLIRHAQNDFVRTGKLAGRTEGVHLDDEGNRQADALGNRLADKKLAAIYSSPLERATETAQAIAHHHSGMNVQIEAGVLEVDFGTWAGKHLRQLARTRLWRIVQGFPSGARFPEGESFFEVQARVISTLDRIAEMHSGNVVIVSHADVLKIAIAHYVGVHLDLFQRIDIAPASISIIQLERYGPRLACLNDTAHYDYVLEKRADD
jgi:probable phosphoglycerate mutase